MNCKQFSKVLHDYIDNELDPELVSRFEKHMNDCKNCNKQYQLMKTAVVDPFQHSKLKEAPVSLWNRIRIDIGKESDGKSSVRRFLNNRRFVFYGVGVFVLVVLIFLPFGRGDIFNDNTDKVVSLYEDLDFNSNADIDFGTSIEEFLL
jgi:hypothetical protein